MDSQNVTWNLIIDEMETNLKVGVLPHERSAAQRVLISAVIQAEYPLTPTHIDECIDYAMFENLVCEQWPKREHVELLETLAAQLLDFIFEQSEAISHVTLTFIKPDISPTTKGMGVEISMSRLEFKQIAPT